MDGSVGTGGSAAKTGKKTAAAFLHGPRDIRLGTHPVAELGPDQLQIRIKAVGICGSDIHYWNDFQLGGDIKIRHPFTLGHEAAGEVVAVGSAVNAPSTSIIRSSVSPPTTFRVGDKVALEVGIACEKCRLCLSGRRNLCYSMAFMGSARRYPHDQGVLRETVNHAAKYCYKLPDWMSYPTGALLEPAAVVMHVFSRAFPTVPPFAAVSASSSPTASFSSFGRDGSMARRVLILGAGTIGLLLSLRLRMHFESLETRPGSTSNPPVTVLADIVADRLTFAAKFGYARHVALLVRNDDDERTASMRELRHVDPSQPGVLDDGKGGYDMVFDCTGADGCVAMAMKLTNSGGKVVVVGMGSPTATLPVSQMFREIDLIGTFRYTQGDYENAITFFDHLRLARLVGKDVPDPASLITATTVGLENLDQAFIHTTVPVTKDGTPMIKSMIELS